MLNIHPVLESCASNPPFPPLMPLSHPQLSEEPRKGVAVHLLVLGENTGTRRGDPNNLTPFSPSFESRGLCKES